MAALAAVIAHLHAPAASGPVQATGAPAPPPQPFAHPVGALTAFGSLPDLGGGVLARQLSSVDPAERNADGAPGNILYKTAHGASVIFAAAGPGVVDNLWVAGSLRALGDIRITVDGGAKPVVDMPATAFFSGTVAPFLSPLVGDAQVSSGGNYSYVPIAFRTSCTIAFTGVTAYWHVGFHRLPPGSRVQPFSGTLGVGAAVRAWRRAGADPHRTAGTRLLTGHLQLAPGARATLARIAGPGRIDTLDLSVPAAAVPAPSSLTRRGIDATGPSSFTLRIDPQNRGVRLVRRLDYAIPDQGAAVYVDGVPAGRFATPGSTNGPYFWRTATVTLPATLTAGRSTLRVSVRPSGPFTAFTYWAQSIVGGRPVTTDTLQLSPASEQAHGFTAAGVLWNRTLRSAYPPAALGHSQALLAALHLGIRFDGSARPAVSAPLGLFFGTAFGAARVRALLFAVHPGAGLLESFWPMPFAHSATLTLRNAASVPVAIGYRVRVRPDPADAAALASGQEGYFHATYAAQTPTTPGHDYVFLSAGGTGKLVGLSMGLSTPPGMPYGLQNLQGNEQIYLDGNRTPAYLGTGTEDFFQGGWYFQHGPFTLPSQGSPVQVVGPHFSAHLAAYRLFLADALPFYRGLWGGLQVGPLANLSADYSSVAFWYGLPHGSLRDAQRISPAATVPAAGAAALGPLTSVFQGRWNGSPSTATGVRAASAAFRLPVSPGNAGVLLRARFDQCPGRQAARVYVDGALVGLWLQPQSDCAERWRESTFLLPAAATHGRSSIAVRLVATAGPWPASGVAPSWSAFGYQGFSLLPGAAAGGRAGGGA